MPELTRRYVVMALSTEAPFDPEDRDGVFVLKPWKDPAALRALAAYRDNCYPELARDLEAWIRAIQAGKAAPGDVGRRNAPHVRTGVEHKRKRGAPPKPKSGGSAPRAARTSHPRPKPGSRHSLQQTRRRAQRKKRRR